jgi:hypothetical protein
MPNFLDYNTYFSYAKMKNFTAIGSLRPYLAVGKPLRYRF